MSFQIKIVATAGLMGALLGTATGLAMGFTESENGKPPGGVNNASVVVEHGYWAPRGDYPMSANADTLVNRSELIIKGEVATDEELLEEGIQPWRGNNTLVKVLEVYKGTPVYTSSPDTDFVVVRQSADLWRIRMPEGTPLYLFLNELDRSRIDHEIFYDYHLQGGVEGQFRLFDGLIRPMAPDYYPTTRQFRGVSEAAFVKAIKDRVED